MKRSASTALFNAALFVAAPHAVATEFDLFGKRGVPMHRVWVKGGGISKRGLWSDGARGSQA